MKTITVTFNEEQVAKLMSLRSTRENQTIEQIATTVVERGLYDLAYRTERNRKVWAQFKEYRKSIRG